MAVCLSVGGLHRCLDPHFPPKDPDALSNQLSVCPPSPQGLSCPDPYPCLMTHLSASPPRTQVPPPAVQPRADNPGVRPRRGPGAGLTPSPLAGAAGLFADRCGGAGAGGT